MKKTLLAAAAMFVAVPVLAVPALAADRFTSFGPAPAPIFNWSGVYAGLHGGYGLSGADWTVLDSNAATFGWPDLDVGEGTNQNIVGWLGGGQIGANLQYGRLVFGVEASGAWTGMKGASDSPPNFKGIQDDTFSTNVDVLLLAGGRIGFAANNLLLYVKGGYATAKLHTEASDTDPNNADFSGSGEDNVWHSGWNVGAGLEVGLSPNVSFAAQYDFVRLGSASHSVGGPNDLYVFDVTPHDMHIVTGRLNFRYGL